jgi:hypothetical protein
MKIPLLAMRFDERFLTHRLRATSAGGIAGGVLAMTFFAYHVYADHYWSWELLSIGITMAVVKWSVITWYRYNN